MDWSARTLQFEFSKISGTAWTISMGLQYLRNLSNKKTVHLRKSGWPGNLDLLEYNEEIIQFAENTVCVYWIIICIII